MTQGADTEVHGQPPASDAGAHRERALWIAGQVLPHEGDLRRMLRRRAPGGLEIDDIVQEIYARLAAMATVDHIHSPRNYIFRMASGVMLDYVRHQKVVAINVVDDIDAVAGASDDPSPEAVVLHRDQLDRLTDIFARLPPRVAEVFRLRRLEGLSQRQVSGKLGVPESTIEKRMARGVYLLAQYWETGGNAEAGPTKPVSRKIRP